MWKVLWLYEKVNDFWLCRYTICQKLHANANASCEEYLSGLVDM